MLYNNQIAKKSDSDFISLQKLVEITPKSVDAAASLTATAATNTAATATLAAVAGRQNVIDGVVVCYDTSPTGGAITVKDGTTTVFTTPITAAGTVFIPVRRKGTAGNTVSAVLAAGGSGVTGRVNIVNAWTE